MFHHLYSSPSPSSSSRDEHHRATEASLRAGVKALDVLTPVGRGQCMLLTGEVGTELSRLGLASIAAQAAGGVRCVYGAVGPAASLAGTRNVRARLGRTSTHA